MKFLLTILMMSNFAMAQVKTDKMKPELSTGGGNGGFIEELIRSELMDRETLKNDQVDKLVEDLGESVKNKVLVPLFKRFLSESLNNLNTSQKIIFMKLKKSDEQLFLDLKLTHIMIGDCNGATTCTGDDLYSDILIDKKEVLKSSYGTSFSELIGLIAHEFIHHFFESVPGHDSYPLAKKFKRYVLKKEFIINEVTRFTINDMLMESKEIDFNGRVLKAVYVENQMDYSNGANIFCEYKGFKRAVDYKTSLIYAVEASDLNVIADDKRSFMSWWLRRKISEDFEIKISRYKFSPFKKIYKYIDCEKK